MAGTSTVATVDEILTNRTELMLTLRKNLERAHVRMCNQANAGRTDVQFAKGDWVLFKLQPYRQTTLARRLSQKLARRFYGPFIILERIGAVAYRLQLPATAKIHNVFHVSKLKRFVGDPIAAFQDLLDEFIKQHPLQTPKAILKRQEVLRLEQRFSEFLVQWKGQAPGDET